MRNSFNRFLVGTIVDRQFSTAFAFELTSGQWTRGSEDWMSAFADFYQHQLSDFVPFSLWTVSSLIEDHFFSERGPRNDHCPAENLFA